MLRSSNRRRWPCAPSPEVCVRISVRSAFYLRPTSAYLESIPVIPAQPILDLIRRGYLVHVDAGHPRAPRSLAEPGAERVHRRRGATRLQLDASIGQVANPAVDAGGGGLMCRRGAEPDALHPAPHDGPHLLQG